MITVEMRFDYDTKTHRLYTTDNIRAPTDIARVSLDVCARLGLTKGEVTLVFMRELTDTEGLALVSEMKRIQPKRKRRRPKRSIYVPVETPGAVDRMALRKSWLTAEKYGSRFYLGIVTPDAGTQGTNEPDVVTRDDAADNERAIEDAATEGAGDEAVFCRFLASDVEKKDGGILPSNDLWRRWASHHADASFSDAEVSGIKRSQVWRYLRKVFPDMPPAERPERVIKGEQSQRYWAGYALRHR